MYVVCYLAFALSRTPRRREYVDIVVYLASTLPSLLFIYIILFDVQREEFAGRMQVSPPGFHVIYLPYVEDIRKIQLEGISRGTRVCESLCIAVDLHLRYIFSFNPSR